MAKAELRQGGGNLIYTVSEQRKERDKRQTKRKTRDVRINGDDNRTDDGDGPPTEEVAGPEERSRSQVSGVGMEGDACPGQKLYPHIKRPFPVVDNPLILAFGLDFELPVP